MTAVQTAAPQIPTLSIAEFEALAKSHEVCRRIVTPEVAERMLGQNTRNRNMRLDRVMGLCKMLKSGKWAYNAQPITFDANGVLQNGQHRLAACLQAHHPIDTLIAFGLPPEAVWSVDRGTPRSLSDHLRMLGEQYSSLLAPVVQLIHEQENGFKYEYGARQSATPYEAEEIIARFPDLRTTVAYIWTLKDIPLSKSVLCFLFHHFGTIDKQAAYDWLEAVIGQTKITPENPLHDYVNHIKEVKFNKVKESKLSILKLAMESFEQMREVA